MSACDRLVDMAVTTGLMTVEEFSKLPKDSGPVYHELRHGEVVEVTRPKLKHAIFQGVFRDIFHELAEPGSYVDIEVAFRPKPEFELRVADVAYLSKERFQKTDSEDYIQGAPDLVVEVLSPSNTVYEINEKEAICLENGCKEFWVFDPALPQIKVSTPDGHTVTYKIGQQIPLPLFGNKTLEADEIFSGCD
jgi:Uma2 family endonuclease